MSEEAPEVFIAYTQDWMGFYVNGELDLEEGSISIEKALSSIGVDHDKAHFDREQMEEFGYTFPDTLDELRDVMPDE